MDIYGDGANGIWYSVFAAIILSVIMVMLAFIAAERVILAVRWKRKEKHAGALNRLRAMRKSKKAKEKAEAEAKKLEAARRKKSKKLRHALKRARANRRRLKEKELKKAKSPPHQP